MVRVVKPFGAALMLAGLLVVPACGTKAPPPAVTPRTSTLAAPALGARPGRARSPWPNSQFFAPRTPAPAPLFSRPRRPPRTPTVHTLRS